MARKPARPPRYATVSGERCQRTPECSLLAPHDGACQTRPQPERLPADAVRCEDWDREPTDLPWQQVRCLECNRPMWARQPEKHDICEGCGYMLRDAMQHAEGQMIRQRADVFVNPFGAQGLTGQTGSLPTPKGTTPAKAQ